MREHAVSCLLALDVSFQVTLLGEALRLLFSTLSFVQANSPPPPLFATGNK